MPEQQTDFIFTAVGEQLGFVGSVGVLALLGVIAWRVLHAGVVARDIFGRLICTGLFAFIAFSVFQNAGMTMGIMPITGIPLPFVSYGGTAVLVFFAAVGFALSVGRPPEPVSEMSRAVPSPGRTARTDRAATAAQLPGLPGHGRRGRARSICPRSTRPSPWSRPSPRWPDARLPGGSARGHGHGPGPAADGVAAAR